MKETLTKYLRILKDNKYLFFLNISDRLFTFLFFLLLARNLSTILYGEIITFFAVTGVFISLLDFGLAVYLQREIAANKSDRTLVFSNIFAINLFAFVLYILLLFAIYYVLYPGTSIRIFTLISVSLYFGLLTETCNKVLSGLKIFKEQFTAFTLARIIILIIFIAGIYIFKINIVFLFLAYFSGMVFNWIYVFLILAKNNIKLNISAIRKSVIINILKQVSPLGLAVVFTFLYNKIDVIIISNLLDYSQVAFYSAAYGVYKSSSLAFTFLLAGGFTRVSEIAGNKTEIRHFFKQYMLLITIICVLVSILLFFFSEVLVKFLYTLKFLPSASILKILSFAVIAIGLNNLTGIILNGIGVFKVVMYITLFALFLNIILNFAFIPIYGIESAAVVTVVTEFFIFLFELYFLTRIIRN